MTENRLASIASLAKTILMGLDREKETTPLPTQMVDLLCRTIIEVSQRDNQTARTIQSAHSSFVQSKITGVEGR
jgi:hypothetical protein